MLADHMSRRTIAPFLVCRIYVNDYAQCASSCRRFTCVLLTTDGNLEASQQDAFDDTVLTLVMDFTFSYPVSSVMQSSAREPASFFRVQDPLQVGPPYCYNYSGAVFQHLRPSLLHLLMRPSSLQVNSKRFSSRLLTDLPSLMRGCGCLDMYG